MTMKPIWQRNKEEKSCKRIIEQIEICVCVRLGVCVYLL